MVWQTFPKFFFEIEAGLNDLTLDPHFSPFNTDWFYNCFLKSTGKFLSRCTCHNLTNQNDVCHILSEKPKNQPIQEFVGGTIIRFFLEFVVLKVAF